MVPEYQKYLDEILKIMYECDAKNIRYTNIENAASALFELQTNKSAYQIGMTEDGAKE